MDERYRVARFRQTDNLNIVYPNRNADAEIYSDRQAFAGACYALSLGWLRRRKFFSGENPIERMEQLGSHQNIITSVEAQLYSSNGAHSVAAMLENGIADFRLENGALAVMRAPYLLNKLMTNNYLYRAIKIFDFSRMDTVLTKRMSSSASRHADEIDVEECTKRIVNKVRLNCSYHLLTISYSSSARSGGHAMAFCRSEKKIIFFDSNRGEFEIPEKEGVKFVRGIVNTYFRKSESITVELLKIS